MRGIVLTLLTVLACSAIYIAYQVTPAYLDYHFMVTRAKQMVHSGDAETMSSSQIHNDFAASMRLNHIRSFQPEFLHVERNEGKTSLVFDYCIDTELLMGLSLNIHFQETVP